MNARFASRMASAAGVVAILITALLLTACPPSPSIAEIEHNPGKYAGKEIVVHGNVEQTAGLLGSGAYRLNDGTGTIWVLSQSFGVPGRGANVRVTGTLVQGASLGGRNFGLALRQTRATK
jgi:hypothetical protein